MINGMVKMRIEGFTHAEIALRYHVSPRTVRRHTQGVSSQLVHARGNGPVDLMVWGAQQFRGIEQRARLTVHELDFALKTWRKAVLDLDALTREHLEGDVELRRRFLGEIWPAIHLRIDDQRFAQDLPPTGLGS